LTSAPPHRNERKKCAACGAQIARDHLEDDYCSVCQRSLRTRLADPIRSRDAAPDIDLTTRVANLLISRLDQRVDLGQLLGEDARTVAGVVRRLRDHGFDIDGDRA
jgi:hypothetical protein